MKEDPVVNCYQFFIQFFYLIFFIFYFLGIARKFFVNYPPIIVCEFDLQ